MYLVFYKALRLSGYLIFFLTLTLLGGAWQSISVEINELV